MALMQTTCLHLAIGQLSSARILLSWAILKSAPVERLCHMVYHYIGFDRLFETNLVKNGHLNNQFTSSAGLWLSRPVSRLLKAHSQPCVGKVCRA